MVFPDSKLFKEKKKIEHFGQGRSLAKVKIRIREFLFFFPFFFSFFQGFPQDLGFWPPRGTSQKKVEFFFFFQ